ncbi:MAG: hypothetical protein O2954_00420 [bacterium]|nr:hypothetical protein [bacterium]
MMQSKNELGVELGTEHNYAFRKRIDQVHKSDRRDPDGRPETGEVVVADGWRIAVVGNASAYLLGVAKDLQDYLFTSMNVSVLLVRVEGSGDVEERAIVLGTRETMAGVGDGLTVARSYRLEVGADRIVVCGQDERGVGRGCYYLEDLMNLREAPFLSPGDETREPVFSPRMVHSGWGIDQYPDPHLNAIAHAGFDAILVFVKGVNRTTVGHLDINDLITRAEQFGLDVYLYSYMLSRKHPEDPEAEAFYESTYGALMRAHPGAKGVVLVGESCEFPSQDSHTTGRLRSERLATDTKPNPGWWPCVDYPEWLNLVKRVIRKYNPDADIVFWTYNWGWAPEEDRLALIRSLPEDVTLQATFEMFENVERRGIPTRCVDYTVSFAGPGKYFSSEAEAAHERGLRLHTMSNTGGQTWDFGVIPYEPVPFQWARRHGAMLEANRNWGLCGLMESHHMGWWPSIVTDLARWAFWRPAPSAEEMIERLARREFGAGAEAAVEAWQHWSEAILDYVPTSEDQYGAFRSGPAYPLLFTDEAIEFPRADYAHFGSDSGILQTNYRPRNPEILDGEIACLEAMAERWSQGLEAMRRAVEATPDRKRENALRMHVLGEFILRCVRTTIHVKRWWKLKQALKAAEGKDEIRSVLSKMKALAEAEIENAELTIPLVEFDSRLGWEPSMEYMADRAHLEWKIAQVKRVLDEEMPAWERGMEGTGKV